MRPHTNRKIRWSTDDGHGHSKSNTSVMEQTVAKVALDPDASLAARPQIIAIKEALELGRTADAVRLFLRATDDGTLAGGENESDLREVARSALGESMLRHLLAACADFACPYCSDGFGACNTCNGTGRADGRFACVPCRTLGVLPCDFCAGSGVATYSFFPAGIQSAIAEQRVNSATTRLEAIVANSPRMNVPPGQEKRVIGREYLKVFRLHAIFQNALGLSYTRNINGHAETARLASRSWRGLAQSEITMARLLKRLVVHALQTATVVNDEARQLFEQERARLLTELYDRLLNSAEDRVRQVRTHRHKADV